MSDIDELRQARARLDAAHRGKDSAYERMAKAVEEAMAKGHSVHVIADVLGFTPGRVYQLRDQARGKGRKPVAS